MSGLPGAGKDTWIARHAPDLPVISLDMIRRELKVTPADDQGAVAALAKSRARELLRRQQSFIWNATNITRALRTAAHRSLRRLSRPHPYRLCRRAVGGDPAAQPGARGQRAGAGDRAYAAQAGGS